MKLSIIIPIYNCEKYIEECLNSVVSEIREHTEIIIIDDGSTDSSANLYKKFKSNNIKVYVNENHGVSFSRNYGIKKATGKYIMFLDADDKLKEGWNEIVYKSMENSDDDVICFSKKFTEKKFIKEEIVQKIIGYKSTIGGSLAAVYSKLYNRKIIEDNNIRFKEDIINGEDLLFNLEILSNTDNISFYPQSIYSYRINYSSATHTFNEKIFSSNTSFLQELKKYLNKININNELKKELYNFSMFNSIYIFAYRISLIKDYNKRKELKDIFNKNEYKEYLNEYKICNRYEKIKRIFIFLIKNKFYELTYILIRIKSRYLKRIKNINKIEMEDI